MDRDSISRIEGWDSRSVAGGYVGLNELADVGFTGAVEAGGTRLLMLNGRVVGVFDGTISAFEDGDATAYEAPDPSLPLLFAMRELDGEVRGKYYTDDTPIDEVDETLSSAGFTGYLELSENVLSGDYYVVYYGGRSLSAAFVGNKGRVVTGEDAMELARDEVGIYEVRAVDIDVQDVPEPPDDVAAAAVVSEEPEEDAVDEPDDAEADLEEATEDDVVANAEPTPSDDADVESAGEGQPESGGDESEAVEAESAADDESVEDEPEDHDDLVEEAEAVESTDDVETPLEPSDASAAASGSTEGEGASGDRSPTPEQAGSSEDTRPTQPSQPRREPEQSEPDVRFEEEARWREARTVPALDPEESQQVGGERPDEADPEEPSPRQTTPDAEDVNAELEAYQERIGRLEAELEASERERLQLVDRFEEAVADREEVEAERDALAERIESLEARLEEAESAAAAAAAGRESTASGSSPGSSGSAVDPETALNQTDLFVRYGSKGKATLATAHDGRATASEVAENLRVESHSRFDSSTATVGGQPFDAFLQGTIQYRFVAWLVEELLYEIQETGTAAGLRDLYDALPKIDRAEFNGTVESRDEEGEKHDQTFDVVCRDRMGKPLVVANINDSLDPATGDMMVRLVEDGTTAGEAHESLGAAFLVTASFFEPDALETAADATRGGGFLSRDSKKSFVKLARNGGYHLCLVEARGDDFHVAVPEF